MVRKCLDFNKVEGVWTSNISGTVNLKPEAHFYRKPPTELFENSTKCDVFRDISKRCDSNAALKVLMFKLNTTLLVFNNL